MTASLPQPVSIPSKSRPPEHIQASVKDARRAGLKYITNDQPGFRRVRRGKGFAYLTPAGRPVAKRHRERIEALAIPPAWESVWICPDSRGHLQATGRDAKGRLQYIYNPAYRERRDAIKFNHALAFGAALPRMRRAITRDLKQPGLPKRKVLALVARLLDRTCLRVGNTEYARKNGSFGLTTMQDRHLKIHGAEVVFQFRAKSGVEQEVTLHDRRMARWLAQTKAVRGTDLFQYRTPNGARHAIQSADINTYLREIAGQDVTAKDFRTWHGTVRLLMELCQSGPATTATEAKRRLNAAIKNTASHLGNRPATCRNYYVHPEIIERYLAQSLLRGGSVTPPRTLTQCESMLLKMIRTKRVAAAA